MIGRGMLAAAVIVAGMGAGAGRAAEPGQPVSMVLEGLRSAKGRILICIARSADYFPDCSKDPAKRHMIVATTSEAISLGNFAPGDYAISIIHDENGNGKLDTFAGIPREGVGFSRNPVLRFGAPSFRSAQFTVAAAPVQQAIRLKYFL